MRQVLVIDDDPSIGVAIQMILARYGCCTVIAPDTDTGLQAFESSTFDVVMVDIFMPGTDGLEAIREFRRRAPATHIVAMSGFRFRDSMASGMDFLTIAAKLGANCSLRKPFGPEQLMRAISPRQDPAPASANSARQPAQGSLR